MKVLVVDDQRSARRVLKQMLADLPGVEIFEAGRFEEAMAVVDASSPLSVSSAKKKRKRKPPTIGPSSASGDPPTISVPLVLGKAARSRLKRNGKVTVKARITFAPQGGLSSTQTAELKIKRGKRKKR